MTEQGGSPVLIFLEKIAHQCVDASNLARSSLCVGTSSCSRPGGSHTMTSGRSES